MIKSLSLCLAGVLVGSFVFADTVRAQNREREEGRSLTLALDFDYAAAISNDLEIDKGGGGAFRIGSELDLLLVTLIPELSFAYHSFGGEQDDRDATTFTGALGGRIRFLKILEPGIFAHAGVGHIGGYDPHTGFAFDAGLTLDLTILPLIDLGVHAAWNRVFGGDDHPGLSFATAGAHVALVL